MNLQKLMTFGLMFIFVLGGSVTAQKMNDPQTGRPAFCFMSSSGSGCNTSLITETAVAHTLEKPLYEWHFSWEVGALHKIDSQWAVGGTLNFIYDQDNNHAYVVALKPRVRRWLSRGLRVDLAAGLTISQFSEKSPFVLANPSITGTLSMGAGDWVSLYLQVEHFRYKPRPGEYFDPSLIPPPFTETNWYIGVSFGCYPGAILAPLALFPTIVAEAVSD